MAPYYQEVGRRRRALLPADLVAPIEPPRQGREEGAFNYISSPHRWTSSTSSTFSSPSCVGPPPPPVPHRSARVGGGRGKVYLVSPYTPLPNTPSPPP